MNKIIKAMLAIFLIGGISFISTSCLGEKSPAPIVEMEGVKIEVGKTTVKEVLDKGFIIEESKIFEPVKTVPGKKFTSIIASFQKDGIDYGSFSVANTSSVEKNVEDCIITSITYFYSNKFYYENASINGMVPKGMNLKQIVEKLGEPTHKYDDRLNYRSKDGRYDTRYEFDKKGILSKSSVEVDEKSL